MLPSLWTATDAGRKLAALPRLAGHKAGTENLRRVIRGCVEFGIKYLTIYAFSTENWARPADEVAGLMNIIKDVIEKELGELQQGRCAVAPHWSP